MGHHGHTGRGAIAGAFAITSVFLVVEAVGGYVSGSLALLADAGHMLGDAAALGMSLWASSVALRPADHAKSFGYRRVEVLAAFVSALALLVVVALILREIPERLDPSRAIHERPMMIVAALGLCANLASGLVLMRAAGRSINVRAALLHVVSDSLGSVAVLAAGGVIYATGWMYADPIASVVVAALIAWGAVRLLRETWHILMEGAPPGTGRAAIGEALGRIDGVRSVHSVHVWCIAPGIHALTAHLVTEKGKDPDEVLRAARSAMPPGLNMEHVTVQIEASSGPDTPDCPLGCGQPCQYDDEKR